MAEKVNMPSQKKEKKKKRKKKLPSDFYDYNLLACTILLVSFGLIMLYSASAYEAASTFKGNVPCRRAPTFWRTFPPCCGIITITRFRKRTEPGRLWPFCGTGAYPSPPPPPAPVPM